MTGEWTEEQLAEFERRFKEAIARPQKLRVLGLSRRTRLRLWYRHQIDHAAIWLLDHGHDRAGTWLWRVTGLWTAPRRAK